MKEPTPEDIKALVNTFDESNWSELHVRTAEFEIRLSKDPGSRSRLSDLTLDQAGSMPIASQGPPTHPPAAPGESSGDAAVSVAAAPPEGMVVVRAPNLGTFYKAPKPGAPPYVQIGDRVDPDTEICVIEVMKLFTPVIAGVAGIVRQAFVNDSELVEFDQPLFMIELADQ